MDRRHEHPARLLWVTEEPPDRSLAGGSIRQSYLFEALASALPTDLLVVGPVEDEQVRRAAASITELPRVQPLTTEHPIARRALELAISLGSPYPLPAYPVRPSRRSLARAISALPQRYDLIYVEHEALAPLITKSRGERWMLTFQHLFSDMIAKEVELAPGRRQRWFRKRDVAKAHWLEGHALRAYDRCVVCSDEDATALAGIGGDGVATRLKVIPNGVDLGRFQVTPLPSQPRVLFPGTLNYSPNVDGAIWFCTEIWPKIRTAVPQATLVLAGRSPVADVLALGQRPGVSVHANVPSMTPYFEWARTVVVPLRIGTGTRLKAIEAMAAGRPVVGTTVGLAGIRVLDGIQALVADDTDTIAAAVIQTLRLDDLAQSLAAAGRAHVESGFGWDRIGAQLISMVTGLLADSREPHRAGARSSSRARW